MVGRYKVPIEPDEGMAQKQRDQELRDTGVAPEEVYSESPEEADVVAESQAERVLPEDVRQLMKRLTEAEMRAESEHDQLLRALAEYNNFRRRSREEMEQARKLSMEDIIIRILPVLDNFERAISTAEELCDYDALHGGVILILRQLRDILEKEGVKPIDAQGQDFDPNIHEAVMREDTDEYPDNSIIEEFKKGYTLGDKVIRPSMVKVARHP